LELSFAESEAQEVKSAVVGVAEAKTAIAGIGWVAVFGGRLELVEYIAAFLRVIKEQT
jgi:hypothetical protein